MTQLQPVAAHGRSSDTFDGLTIVENDDLAIASLAMRRGADKAFAKASKSLFKAPLPEPVHGTSVGPWTVFWTGQQQWFVLAPIATHEDIEARLRAVFADSASITEQTGAWVRFDMEGRNCAAALERLTMLDFAAMQPGDATRTTVHHIGLFLSCTENGFAFMGPRSSAGSLHHALVTAAASVC